MINMIYIGFFIGIGIYLAELVMDIPIYYGMRVYRKRKSKAIDAEVSREYVADYVQPTTEIGTTNVIKGVQVDPINGEPINPDPINRPSPAEFIVSK